MNGIIININPVIFHLGGFELRWYSLAIMLAVISGMAVAVHMARKKGIAPDHMYSLTLWVVVAGIVGARLFHVMDKFEYYASNPSQILQFQQGGLAIWGGLVSGAIAAFVYARISRLPLGRLFDAVAPGLLVAHIIGRFGCIVNGDAYGGITSLPWGFIYTHPHALIPPALFGVPTHPYPVYEILWNIPSLLAVLWIGRHVKKDGLVFLSYVSLYSLARFVLSFVRQENTFFLGLQQAQILAIAIFFISAGAFFYLYRRNKPVTKALNSAQS